jgi:hypothetical protein
MFKNKFLMSIFQLNKSLCQMQKNPMAKEKKAQELPYPL